MWSRIYCIPLSVCLSSSAIILVSHGSMYVKPAGFLELLLVMGIFLLNGQVLNGSHWRYDQFIIFSLVCLVFSFMKNSDFIHGLGPMGWNHKLQWPWEGFSLRNWEARHLPSMYPLRLSAKNNMPTETTGLSYLSCSFLGLNCLIHRLLIYTWNLSKMRIHNKPNSCIATALTCRLQALLSAFICTSNAVYRKAHHMPRRIQETGEHEYDWLNKALETILVVVHCEHIQGKVTLVSLGKLNLIIILWICRRICWQ